MNLPNISNLCSFKNINIELSSKIIGRKLSIKNKSNLIVDDFVFLNYVNLNKIDFTTTYDRSKKILDTLNFNCNSDFSDLIPQRLYKSNKDSFLSIIDSDISSYFTQVLPRRYELTSKIKDATYDHVNTSTGRMKIVHGNNFLTMKKSDRVSINTEEDSHLVEIDIKSAEPALLHRVLYDESPEDVYGFFGDTAPRQKIKIAVISSIYGSSTAKVKKISGLETNQIKKIQEHFQLRKIKEYILSEYDQNGFFFNLYGRPLYHVNSPINYWLQSSAADYACLAFLDLVKRGNFKLKACIHDAVILEANKKEVGFLEKLKKVKDPISNIALRVEYSLLK